MPASSLQPTQQQSPPDLLPPVVPWQLPHTRKACPQVLVGKLHSYGRRMGLGRNNAHVQAQSWSVLEAHAQLHLICGRWHCKSQRGMHTLHVSCLHQLRIGRQKAQL